MTIRLPSELVAAGLAPLEKLADLTRVAERYAIGSVIAPSPPEMANVAMPGRVAQTGAALISGRQEQIP